MIRVFLTVIFLISGSISSAETVPIQSGEHSTFSRLVLRFGTIPGWEMGKVDGGFELRSDRSNAEFNLGQVFEYIPRERVLDVADLGKGNLFISSDCECHVDVFELQGGYVVVDVKNGPAPENVQALNEFFPVPKQTEFAVDNSADQRLPLVVGPTTPSKVVQLPAIFGLPLAQMMEVEEKPQSTSSAEKSPDRAEVDTSVSELEKTLLEQISRAATQGLLEADLPDVQDSVGAVDEIRVPIPDDVPMQILETNNEPKNHFFVSTAIDRARIGSGPVVSATNSGNECLSGKFFQVADWGVPLEEGSDIGAYRAGLITEYDTTDVKGATALVRHYIYTTFGAEARALLQYYRDLIDRPDILNLMGQIMDKGHADQATDYVAQMACDGPVALWSVLSQPQIFGYQTINSEAVVFEFFKLPAHLRRHLGPILVRDFLAAGDANTANAIKGAVERVRTDLDENLGMMDAEVALSAGDTLGAARSFDGVIEEGDARLPEALLNRAELMLKTGDTIPDDFISLLESVGYENRGSSAELDLRRTAIVAMAHNGNVPRALGRYDDFIDDFGLEATGLGDLRAAVFSSLVLTTDDYQFLTQLVARKRDVKLLIGLSKHAYADRALALGLPELSKEIIATASIPAPEERVLLAEALLQQRRPQVALGYLTGIETEAALSLKAEALQQMEDHASASQVFKELGQLDAQKQEAWRAGRWGDVADIGEGVRREASLMMLGAVADEVNPDEKPLESSQALIENSIANRETVEALLDDL